ncbi:hypothetical protein GCM10010149_46620 [Nonomuraea roseoviolacea subsp. roseoviolacea]|uniref:hypothetical protein n=1 Tax=Nonomuraea roseoviolacea TaxID=103837 RepID=UPI0031DB506B
MRAREIHAGLHLLDRQVVRASTGRLVCKVDDLELTGDPPHVTAILAGPLALGPRIGGVPGRLMVAVAELLSPLEDPQPWRIPMHLLTELGSAVEVGGDPEEPALETWTRRNIIARIPGSGTEEVSRERPARHERHPAARLGAYLDKPVLDAEGTRVGNVADVRLRQDGPLLMEVQQAFTVAELIVVPHWHSRLFGYERGPGGRAPKLVSALIRGRFAGARLVAWDQVETFGPDGFVLNVPASRLAPLTDLYEPDPRRR